MEGEYTFNRLSSLRHLYQAQGRCNAVADTCAPVVPSLSSMSHFSRHACCQLAGARLVMCSISDRSSPFLYTLQRASALPTIYTYPQLSPGGFHRSMERFFLFVFVCHLSSSPVVRFFVSFHFCALILHFFGTYASIVQPRAFNSPTYPLAYLIKSSPTHTVKYSLERGRVQLHTHSHANAQSMDAARYAEFWEELEKVRIRTKQPPVPFLPTFLFPAITC